MYTQDHVEPWLTCRRRSVGAQPGLLQHEVAGDAAGEINSRRSINAAKEHLLAYDM